MWSNTGRHREPMTPATAASLVARSVTSPFPEGFPHGVPTLAEAFARPGQAFAPGQGTPQNPLPPLRGTPGRPHPPQPRGQAGAPAARPVGEGGPGRLRERVGPD